MRVCIINILLVKKRARTAMLIEPMNFKEKERFTNLFDLFQLVRDFGLKITLENKNLCRFLVGREKTLVSYAKNPSDQKLGKLLGFFCYKHDYSNENKKRMSAEIKVGPSQLMVEVCEMKKLMKNMKKFQEHYQDLLQKIGRVLIPRDYHIPTLVFTEINEQNERIRAIERRDQVYIRENMDEYINDLYNHWAPDSILEKMLPDLVEEKRFPLLNFIWKHFVQEDIPSKLPYSGEDVNKRMAEFDKIVFYKKIPAILIIKREWNKLYGKYAEIKD